MAAIAPADEFAGLLRRLRSAERRWTGWCVGLWLWRGLGVAGVFLAVLVVIEIALRPGVLARMLLVYALAAPFLVLVLATWLWRALSGLGLRATAQRVQARHPQIGRRLEGALDLHGLSSRSPLVEAALAQTAQAAVELDFVAAARLPNLRRRLLPTALILGFMALACLLFPARILNAMQRLFLPRDTETVVGAVRITGLTPGKDVTVVEGADLTVKVTVDKPQNVRQAVIELGEQTRRLSRADESSFAYTLRGLRAATRYRVRLGGSASRTFNVEVVPRPAVTALHGRVTPPPYTGLESYDLVGTDGAVRAPVGSRVQLDLRTNHSIREGHARLSTGMVVPLIVGDYGLQGSFDVKTSGTYTISLLDTRGHTNANPLARPIECLPDELPRLRLIKPGKNVKLGLGETLAVRIQALDDYGLKEVALYFKRNRRGEPQLLKRWPVAQGNAKDVSLPFAWTLTPPTFDTGDVVAFYAEGTDFGPGESRIGRSTALYVTIINPEKAARRDTSRLEKVKRIITQLLERQRVTHKATAALPVTETRSRVLAKKLRDKQAAIRLATVDASGLLAKVDDAVAKRIRTVLLGLGANELAAAVNGLEAVLSGEEVAARRAGVVKAVPAQAEVVKRFNQILGILPELQEKLQGPPEEEKGEDLPANVEEALKKLKDGLKEFEKDQRKIVEATEDLKKKNVDDFAEEDKKKLEALAAKEEDWANFLKDLHSDLSKVPKQDFSNPSLLGEVLAVLEEVELAEGAMTKKEVEIATEAASTGMELAESLSTHLEKWLPDEPDRTAWKMEEPLEDYEVPMAELPDKLEDIVGDLVEQEEDLMEEADDASSSWADSLDKGAGWDALDGPISNYSAQGVTGNQLPNTSEIGGRSGEGRQGKSHGEMVGDTAVGKGGRKTPSRLSPDAFEKGEIKDESKDASGGSTGGGKGGAAGAEGLEGPPPPPEKGPLPRLLGKQAELRNKAERLNANLKLMGYNTAVLENTLAEMRSVEQELKSGRYKSASRRAHYAVDSLRTTKDAVLGEADVRADRAASLPRELQREIMDALDAGLPKGYEDLVKAYYERLAQGD